MTETPNPIHADTGAVPVAVDLERAVLVLEDGTRYEGRAYARGRAVTLASLAVVACGLVLPPAFRRRRTMQAKSP